MQNKKPEKGHIQEVPEIDQENYFLKKVFLISK